MNENMRKERLSVAYVSAIAAHCGFGVSVPDVDDDSIDLIVSGAEGKRPRIELQLKATAQIEITDQDFFSFELSLKNYNDLRVETINPRILVVLRLPKEEAERLQCDRNGLIIRRCAYYLSLQNAPETENKKNVTVKIPTKNLFSPEALADMLEKAANGEMI